MCVYARQVLVAPVTEKGARQRDVYLPGEGWQWQDAGSFQVYEGGTMLYDYRVALDEVAIFIRRRS